MRERRPADWVTDLRDRHGLETQVGRAIDVHRDLARLKTSTSALDRLDFQLLGPGEQLCELELKAKRQRYRGWGANWPSVPEKHLFMVDELALRRLVDAGRFAFLLVRDVPGGRWCLWSTTELVLTTKVRVARQLAGPRPAIKGKVLIDLRSAAATHATLAATLSQLAAMVGVIQRRWADISPWPWGERNNATPESA
jgi:hypothetical protein